MAQYIGLSPAPVDRPGQPQQPDLRVMTTTPTTTAPRVIAGQSVSSPSRSTRPRSSSRIWASCAAVAARAGRLVIRLRYELAPLGINTAVTSLAWCEYATGTSWGTGLAYGAGTLAAGTLAGFSLKHKHPQLAIAGAGLTGALADIGINAMAGPSTAGLITTALATIGSYWVYVPWLTARRHERMKLHVDTVKAKGAVPAAMGLDAIDPGLTGATLEETKLRRAIHALVGVAPTDVAFAHHATGWSATVAMPPGRNTSAAAIINKRTQLAANLGLEGSLTLHRGASDNQFTCRFNTVDVLEGTIAWTGPSITSITQPILLAYAEDGTEILQTLHRNHVFVAGASDNGKSGVINLIALNLLNCDDVDIYGIDLKAGAPELGIYRDVLKMLATTAEQARQLLEWVFAEYLRRGELLGGLGTDGVPVRQWVPGKHGKDIVVVSDELADLIEQDPELAVLYRRLAALVRYVGIVLVSATQTPSAKVFGGDKDGAANYQVQIGLRVVSPTQTNIVMGAGMHGEGWRLSELDAPGKVMVRSRENPVPKKAKAIYANDLDIANEIARHHARLGTAPSNAQAEAPRPQMRLLKTPPPLLHPDGTHVEVQPDLYRLFLDLQPVTKEELTAAGPFASRDTVRRALDSWVQHGVQSRKEGRAERFYLPDLDSDD